MGIQYAVNEKPLDAVRLQKAIEAVDLRNRDRFSDANLRIRHLLKRENLGQDKASEILMNLKQNIRVFFQELFHTRVDNSIERITGFLALLELIRNHQVVARQRRANDPILIMERREEDESL